MTVGWGSDREIDYVDTDVYTSGMTTTIQKWGNSCAVRLPHDILRKLDLKEGHAVEIREEASGILSIIPVSQRAFSLAQMVARITKKNQHEINDWGKPVGKEV